MIGNAAKDSVSGDEQRIAIERTLRNVGVRNCDCQAGTRQVAPQLANRDPVG